MEIEHLIRYTELAVGLKPSAMQGKARLRGLYRIISSKTIISVASWGAQFWDCYNIGYEKGAPGKVRSSLAFMSVGPQRSDSRRQPDVRAPRGDTSFRVRESPPACLPASAVDDQLRRTQDACRAILDQHRRTTDRWLHNPVVDPNDFSVAARLRRLPAVT